MSEAPQATGPRHVAVLSAEVLAALEPQAGEVFVDATVGSGGHTRLLAERVGPGGRIIGLDRDQAMLELASPRLGGLPVTLVRTNFDSLRSVLADLGLGPVDGVLADLGTSSDQLDCAERGFSFGQAGPLDMRMDRGRGEPAGVLLRRLGERELADLFWRYGEERHSRKIARAVVDVRKRTPLETTEQLADLVRRCVPRPPKGDRKRPAIDPATRVFQALRIAVNDELGSLDRFLEALPGCVRPGGRVAVISFHSLEDRRVKQAFRGPPDDPTSAYGNKAPPLWEILTRKPVEASEEEVRRNPRSRSARLRAARRTAS
jgi:16S rRNA (cytosine1402-N4)-methyltransferase